MRMQNERKGSKEKQTEHHDRHGVKTSSKQEGESNLKSKMLRLQEVLLPVVCMVGLIE